VIPAVIKPAPAARLEHPILFSAPMVNAILAGRKTQTRRLIRPQPFTEPGLTGPMVGHRDLAGVFADHVFRPCAAGLLKCRYGQPGDRLWVREAWKKEERTCDFSNPEDQHACTEHCQQTYVYYAATPREGLRAKPDGARITYLDERTPLTDFYQRGWKPSIHMPRWASRIQLEVTATRVQRLQEITAEDAKAEGLAEITKDGRLMKFGVPDRDGLPGTDNEGWPWAEWEVDPRAAFRKLWDSINADRMSWASNPWVWCVSFERVTP
jgi:hypothetical protein